MMSWLMIAGLTIFGSLIAARLLNALIARRRSRKGLEWSDNSPTKPPRKIGR